MQKGANLKRILKDAVKTINSKAIYGDALLTDISELSIAKDYSTVDISNTGEKGIKLRAFNGEQWFEKFTTDLSDENIKKIANELVENMKIVKNPITFEDEKIEKNFADVPAIDPKEITLKEKIKVIDKIIDYFNKQEHLKNGRARYDEEITHKIFCSENKYLEQTLSRVMIASIAFVEDSEGAIRYSFEIDLQPGFEVSKKALQIAKTASENAKEVRKSKKIKPGKYHCILSPDVSGLLAHESFGHGMESDTVYKDRALAKEWKGKRIAADFVNIIDDGSRKNCHGTLYFDDEGQIAKPTYLVKNGIVNDYITEMLTAKKMDVRRTANGKAESFDHKNYARMTNTFFAKGPHNYKDMLKKVKDGFLIKSRGGGMEDPKAWGVQLQGLLAQRIKNGKLLEEYYDDVGITGYLPRILGNIKEVSKEFSIGKVGHCGKGHKEWVPVDSGGSYLRIEELNLA